MIHPMIDADDDAALRAREGQNHQSQGKNPPNQMYRPNCAAEEAPPPPTSSEFECLEVVPDVLRFAAGSLDGCRLKLRNMSANRSLAFKLRTTAPRRIRIASDAGLLSPGEEIALLVEPKDQPIANIPGPGPRFQLRYAFLESQDSSQSWRDFENRLGGQLQRRVLLSDVLTLAASSSKAPSSPHPSPPSANDTKSEDTPQGEDLRLLMKNVSDTPLTNSELARLRRMRSSMELSQWKRWLVYARSQRLRIGREEGQTGLVAIDHSQYSGIDVHKQMLRPAALSAEEAAKQAIHKLREVAAGGDALGDDDIHAALSAAEAALLGFCARAREAALGMEKTRQHHIAQRSELLKSAQAARHLRTELDSLRGETYRCTESIVSDFALLSGALARIAALASNPSVARSSPEEEHSGSCSEVMNASTSIGYGVRTPTEISAETPHVAIICRVPRSMGAACITVGSHPSLGGSVLLDLGQKRGGRLAFSFPLIVADSHWEGVGGDSIDPESVYSALAAWEILSWAQERGGGGGDKALPGPWTTLVSCGCEAAGKSAILEGIGLCGRGLMSLFVSSLFERISARSTALSSPSVSVSLSAIELYGGQVRDLLSSEGKAPTDWNQTRGVLLRSAADFERACSWAAASRRPAPGADWKPGTQRHHPHAHALYLITLKGPNSEDAGVCFVDACASITDGAERHNPKLSSSSKGRSGNGLTSNLLWSQSSEIAQGELLILSEILRRKQAKDAEPCQSTLDESIFDSTQLSYFLKKPLCSPNSSIAVLVNVSSDVDSRDEAAEALLFAETLQADQPIGDF